MGSGKKKSRKLIWLTSLFGLAALGVGVAFIFMSSLGVSSEAAAGSSDSSTETAEAAAEETGNGDAAGQDGEKDSADEPEGEEKGEGEDGEGEDEEEDKVPVEIAEVTRKPISSYLTTTANLEAENEARVLAETEGLIVEILVEEGEAIQKGQVLARLEEGDKAIRVEKARLKLENEKTNFTRSERMLASKLISDEDFQKITYNLGIARGELDEATYLLSRTEIRAPFSGVVTERIIKPGARVKPSDHLFSLVSFRPLLAKIYLPERDALDVQTGDQVMLVLNAVDGERFSGEISLISPVVDPNTGTVKVTIEVTRIPQNVRPGSFVTVNLVRETHDRALAVPREAVIRELQESFVYVIEDLEAKKRDVKLGFEENGYIEILSGLDSGEQIVTVGQGGLKDGMKVEIIDT